VAFLSAANIRGFDFGCEFERERGWEWMVEMVCLVQVKYDMEWDGQGNLEVPL